MELTITKQEKKPLLKFTEVEARISFHGATPTKKDVATSLSAALKTKQDLLIVRQVENKYGQQVADVRARVYDNKEALTKLEQESMIKKNDFTAKPKEGEEAAAPAEKPTEAPKEEAPKVETPEAKPEEKKEAPKEKPKAEKPAEEPKAEKAKEEAKPKAPKEKAEEPKPQEKKEGDA